MPRNTDPLLLQSFAHAEKERMRGVSAIIRIRPWQRPPAAGLESQGDFSKNPVPQVYAMSAVFGRCEDELAQIDIPRVDVDRTLSDLAEPTGEVRFDTIAGTLGVDNRFRLDEPFKREKLALQLIAHRALVVCSMLERTNLGLQVDRPAKRRQFPTGRVQADRRAAQQTDDRLYGGGQHNLTHGIKCSMRVRWWRFVGAVDAAGMGLSANGPDGSASRSCPGCVISEEGTPMNIGLFEDSGWKRLLPLTWFKASFELRCGIDRLIDKVRTLHGRVHGVWVRPSLREVVVERRTLSQPQAGQPWLLLNSRALLPHDDMPDEENAAWVRQGTLVAARLSEERVREFGDDFFLNDSNLARLIDELRTSEAPDHVRLIEYPWDLIEANGDEIRRQCREGGMHAGRVYPGAHLLNPAEIHIGSGAVVYPGVVLDAENGPVHIAENAQIHPNAVLIGPCHVGEGSTIRPATIVRESTTIGRVCKIGGEIEASIIHSYSNKQHDGFCGHSYIGEWVNLGAGTITSDLKNTYGAIRAQINGVGVETGHHFLGSIIGDHSKTGIGTILPTGGVIGVMSNVFTQRVVQKFVPSFAWLTEEGMTRYRLEKAVHLARVVMGRRDVELTDAELRLLEHVAEEAKHVEAAGWQ